MIESVGIGELQDFDPTADDKAEFWKVMEHEERIWVVDLEATCWENNNVPPGQVSEIIEIGFAEVDLQKRELVDKGQIVVVPIRSEVSAFCTQLTGWTMEALQAIGGSWSEACEEIHNRTKEMGAWASWGKYDRVQVMTDCMRTGIANPFPPVHVNLKQMHARLRSNKPRGLAKALDEMRLGMEGRHHRGVDDAKNAARILVKLMSDHPESIGDGVS